jgi:DNA-nicking Smr family endonuclease
MSGDETDPIIVPIEDSLDLHAFAPRDVRSVVDEYLQQAVAHGFGEVRLIHGKGKGVQRAMVQKLLSEHACVLDFFDAPVGRGGWGATVVVLRG